jgi:hypothetical protein
MTESWYSCCGGRSWPQSKYGFTTTEVIVWPAESSVFRWSSSPNVYEYSDGSLSMAPSIALAYGSSSSFDGSHRWPCAGSYGPCTR